LLRYFDQHFKEAKSIVAHRNHNVESLSFSPGDVKFATAGSDGFVKIWDLERAARAQDAETGEAECESSFENSGHVVWSVAWHPAMALVAAGTQDGYVKFWDPRQVWRKLLLPNTAPATRTLPSSAFRWLAHTHERTNAVAHARPQTHRFLRC
jgi:WD40 repeat protein